MEDPSDGSISEASVETWPLGPATDPPSLADPEQSFSARSWQSEQEASESTALNSPSVVDVIASAGRSTSGKLVEHLVEDPDPAALNDEVERSISELLDIVKACRRSQAASPLGLESRNVPPAHADTLRTRDEPGKAVRPASATASRKVAAQAAPETRRSEVTRLKSPTLVPPEAVKDPPKPEDPAALERIDALHSEAALLRSELREADLAIQAAATDCAAANADLRESRLRHQQWLRSTQEESFRLRKECRRLEKSCHQASAEEKRIADVQSQPGATSQKLAALQAACQRLESENEKLEEELEAGQAELNSSRQAVPRAGPSARSSQSPKRRSGTSPSRSLTPPQRQAPRLEHDSSMPVLRRNLDG